MINKNGSYKDLIYGAFRDLGDIHESNWVINYIDQKKLDSNGTILLAENIIKRKKLGEPLAYILENLPFLSLNLHVGPGVLIPRPETEELAELMVQETFSLCIPDPVIVDLGAGSGALGLAVSVECLVKEKAEQVHLLAVEKSIDALAVLQSNLFFYENLYSQRLKADLVNQSWCTYRPTEKVDVVLGNPPYITHKELEHVDKSVKFFEPHSALVPTPLTESQKNMLENFQLDPSYGVESALVPLLENLVFSSEFLKAKGVLGIEVGMAQIDFINSLDFKRICEKLNLNLRLMSDLSSKPRFLVGKKNG